MGAVVGFGAMPIGTPVGRSVAITAYRVPDAVQRLFGAAPQSRDPCGGKFHEPRICSAPRSKHSASKTRLNALARTLVHALKYQDRTDLAPAMGRWMARAGRELLGDADALVPVPLHWRRGWSLRDFLLILLTNLAIYPRCYLHFNQGKCWAIRS
jgi:hypothetical protein